MAWTAPATFTTGQVITAADMNAQVRDNLLETAPAKATTKGDSFWATAANAIARLGVGADGTTIVADSAQTTGSKWGNVNSAEPKLLTLPRPDPMFVGETFGDNVWPTANKAIFIPVYLSEAKTVDKIHLANGSVVSGNVDVGLYDASGTRLVNKGSTAQSGTNVEQVYDITNQALSAKTLYYVAIAMDNVTGRLYSINAAKHGLYDAGGLFEQATAFALPSPATFAAITVDYVPLVVLEFTA